jgi:hypothetical protein
MLKLQKNCRSKTPFVTLCAAIYYNGVDYYKHDVLIFFKNRQIC